MTGILLKTVSNYNKDIPEVKEPLSLLEGKERQKWEKNSSKIYNPGRYSKINATRAKYQNNTKIGTQVVFPIVMVLL